MSRFVLVLFILFVTRAMPGTAQEVTKINWLTFEQLTDSLSSSSKKTLLFFHTDWCTYCRKMEEEVFTKPDVIAVLNKYYYTVEMDAESVDTISFDGQLFTNKAKKKRSGQFHDLAFLLGQRKGRLTMPVLLLLDEEFYIKEKRYEYLDSKKLLRMLEKHSGSI